jgi:hypothetical protein
MFKVVVERYRNLIILAWCIIIFVFYKVIFDFQFENGSSLLFLFILLCVPVSLQMHYVMQRKAMQQLKKAHQKTFFGQIQYDFLTGMINTKLLFTLEHLAKETKVTQVEDIITIRCGNISQVNITFTPLLCRLEIENTKIVYNLYYERVVFDTSEYDQKGFRYFRPEKLYQSIIAIIRLLKNERLFYQELRQGKRMLQYQLIDRTNGENIIYKKVVNHSQLFAEDETIHENRIII